MKFMKTALICVTVISSLSSDAFAQSCLHYYSGTIGVTNLVGNFVIIKTKIADAVRRRGWGFSADQIMELAVQKLPIKEMSDVEIVKILEENARNRSTTKRGVELNSLKLEPYIAKAKANLSAQGLKSSSRIAAGRGFMYSGSGFSALKAELGHSINSVLQRMPVDSKISVQDIVNRYYEIDATINKKGLSQQAENHEYLTTGLTIDSLVRGKTPDIVVSEFESSIGNIEKLMLGELTGIPRDTFFFNDKIFIKDLFKIMSDRNNSNFGIKEAIELVNESERTLNLGKDGKEWSLWDLPAVIRVAELSAKLNVEPKDVVKAFPYLELIYPGGNLGRRLGVERASEEALIKAAILESAVSL